jgi:hypothetical protein
LNLHETKIGKNGYFSGLSKPENPKPNTPAKRSISVFVGKRAEIRNNIAQKRATCSILPLLIGRPNVLD